jgi:hypothetical protein
LTSFNSRAACAAIVVDGVSDIRMNRQSRDALASDLTKANASTIISVPQSPAHPESVILNLHSGICILRRPSPLPWEGPLCGANTTSRFTISSASSME